MSAPLKPHALIPNPDGIPNELKAKARWVVWQYQHNPERGEWGKVPIQARPALFNRPQVRRASSTDPKTWSTFEEAYAAYQAHPPVAGDVPPPEDQGSTGNEGLDGIGICLTPEDGLVGVDLDKCLADGILVDEEAKEALELLAGTYVERSPSGTGLRAFCRGRKPGVRCKSGDREMYDGRDAKGNPGGRYLTLTGHSYGDPQPITNKQEAIDALYSEWFAKPEPAKEKPPTADQQPVPIEDAALLERMFASKNGADIKRLWDGDTSAYAKDRNDGTSEADLALASSLAWWCDYDPARADRLFRQSALYRPKWDERRGEQTYGERTLERASESKGPGDGYTPRAGRITVGTEGDAQDDEIIINRQIKDVVCDIVTELKRLELGGHPRIYSRGDGLLVEMHTGYQLREVTKPDSLKALLHDHLKPVVEKEDKNGPYTVPSVFSTNHTALLTRKTEEFPPIKAVSDIPLMLPDGTILLEPGYHQEHGYYLNTAGLEVALMPLEEARELFLETFNEVSYQAPQAGFTATLAFILQPHLMPVIDDLTPMYAVLGSRRAGSGTGKGYLLDCIYRIHRGRPYTHDGSMPATDEEMGKVLFSGLSEGASHMIFDDIDHLKHRSLMAAITSRTYKGRILGVSQRHEVSTAVTWAVSGNAPEIHRDFYRRIIPIYLGVGKARAWERPYSRPDLNRHILENRNLYVSAALSILEHRRKQGMPLSTGVIRGFDRWSAVMGGVLEAAGFPHLLEARDGLDEFIEVDNSDLDLLVSAWQGCNLADKKLKGKDLLHLAQMHELFSELYEGRTEAAGASELGKFLKPFTNDVFGEHYLRREFDSDSKTWRYFLESVPDAPKLLSEVFDFSTLKTSTPHPRSTPVNPALELVTGVLRGSTGNVFRDGESIAARQAMLVEDF